MDNNVLKERLKTAREKKGLSKAEAARRLNLTSLGYYRYEYGERTPSPQTLGAIAECFGTTVSYLTGETDDPTPDYIIVSKDKNPALFDLVQTCMSIETDPEDTGMPERFLRYYEEIIKAKITAYEQ